MNFKKEEEDVWKVLKCENVECETYFIKGKEIRHTIYTYENKLYIVCYACFIKFWKEMKALYPDKVSLPLNFS